MTRLLYNSADHLLSARHRQYAEPLPTNPQTQHIHPHDAMAQHESHVEKSHMPHEVSAVTARRLSKPFEGSLPLSRNPRARQRYDAHEFRARTPRRRSNLRSSDLRRSPTPFVLARPRERAPSSGKEKPRL